MRRNSYFSQVAKNYLFSEVAKRKEAFFHENPHSTLISLSIGDTTEPLTPTICEGLTKAAALLGTREGYTGYGAEKGNVQLRTRISQEIYQGKICPDAIFISDGAKCDIGRLTLLFGPNVRIAVEDPSYPAYIDTAIIHRGYENTILPLPCTPENDFFPDLTTAASADILYICSPNNPTGKTYSAKELEHLVAYAKAHKQFIIFDSAYAFYVQDGRPRSIYEIPGSKEVAIEIGSFSKMAGFTGIRLGWMVVPSELCYEDGHTVQSDWVRLITTFYNGASSLAQQGGIAALSPTGLEEITAQIRFYKENASLLRQACLERGWQTYGGIHSPYLWIKTTHNTSWEAFDDLLRNAHILTTPGIGFGKSGEGFLRLSSFASREVIHEAVQRIKVTSCATFPSGKVHMTKNRARVM